MQTYLLGINPKQIKDSKSVKARFMYYVLNIHFSFEKEAASKERAKILRNL